MKCPNCGFDKILPTYKFCPKCRTALSNNVVSTTKAIDLPKQEPTNIEANNGTTPQGGLDIIRNKAIWSIAPGEIARHISPKEFDSLSDLKGLVIEDGVTAIVCIDGVEVARISGGVYDFLAKVDDGKGLVEKAKNLAGKIWRFFAGEKKGESDEQRDKRKESIRTAIKAVTDNSIVSIYLKVDRPFPITLGTDGKEFAPYDIRTKFLDVKVGVSMQMQISNFEDFIKYYLLGHTSVVVSDVEKELNSQVKTLLQNELKSVEIDEFGINDDIKNNISDRIVSLSGSLNGVSVVKVLDVTTNSEEFERFRKIETELYCSEKELSYLHRTNEFKNRLASVNNEVIVNEAKTEFDLKKALDQINNDALLHEDEIEQFIELLAIQKRIRQAKNEVEEEKSLLELKGNQLINEDDFEAIVSDLDNKKFERDQLSEAFRVRSLANTAKAKLKAETELVKEKVNADEEINETIFEARKKEIGRNAEEIELETALYGRQFVLRKQQILDNLEVERITLEKDIENRRKIDEYTDERADKDYIRSKRQIEDEYDLGKRKTQDEMEILRQKAELARQNMEAIKAQEFKSKELDIDLEKARIQTQATMTADQLAAQALKDLDANAQAEFMRSLGSEKENAFLKQTATDKDALYQQMLSMQKDAASQNSAQQMEMLKQMMDFAKTSAMTTAAAATGRMEDITAMKDEYKKQMEHEQVRTDSAQDKALNYTSKITIAETKRPLPKEQKDKISTKNNEGQLYSIPEFGEKQFSFEQIATYISKGIVEPTTEFDVNGELVPVSEIDEFYPLLKKYCMVTCPVCGSKGIKGTFCPECGSDL